MKSFVFKLKKTAAILLATAMMFTGGTFLFADHQVAYADDVSSWTKLANAVAQGGTQTITLSGNFDYNGKSIKIPAGADITIKGSNTIYSTTLSQNQKYESMFVVESGGKLTIDNGVTLSARTNLQTCPDGSTYTADKFTGVLSEDGKTYEPKGFFIQVEGGGTATLNGTLSDFVTSRDKATTPRYVAPVVANGENAKFDLGSKGVIKNNLVGYIVNDDMAYEDAQTIKQYVKGAPPNVPRRPNAATQKSNKDKFGGRARGTNPKIDGDSPGSGVTATAGAVIYKDGAKGTIQGTITNNRADTGGIMVSGEETIVNIEEGTAISRNVGVQFGGGSTVEQGGTIVMNDGEMLENVAWFGGGAVYATENGVAWLLGLMSGSNFLEPQFDNRLDGVFEMQGGSLHDNTAFTRGGAILADSDGVRVVKGKLQNNLSRMLGGAVYVMGDHPLYTYTMRLDSVYIHDNTAVSGQYSNDPSNQWNNNNYGGATLRPEKQDIDGMPASQNLDAKNKLLQTKLVKPSDDCTYTDSPILDSSDLITKNTDDTMDGKGSDGTGGGVWLCAYGNTTFDAGKPERVVIANNYATGTKGYSSWEPTKSAFQANTAISNESWSGRAGGSDFHSDTGDSGTVVIKNWDSETSTWMNENTDSALTQEDSVTDKILNLVSKGNVKAMDNPNVEVSGNIARRGGGLASNGTFYLGVSDDQVNVETSIGLGKHWAPSANQKPLAMRVTAKADGHEAVVADVPLDGKANPPIGEFESVEELSPTIDASGFTVWNGHFSLPLQLKATDGTKINVFNFTMSEKYKNKFVTNDPTNNPTLIPAPGDISPISSIGRTNLANLLTLIRNEHRDAQGKVNEEEVKAAIKEAVSITFNDNLTFECTELEAEYNSSGALVVKTNKKDEAIESNSYVLTWDQIDLSKVEFNLTTTPQIAIITKEDGSQETVELYQIHLLGLDLRLEATNDNWPLTEKYVNKDVHSDIVNFDQEFVYDIMAYVPVSATEFTISDELVKGLEFADKDGNPSTDPWEVVQSVVVKYSNNHEVGDDGTVKSGAVVKTPSGTPIDFIRWEKGWPEGEGYPGSWVTAWPNQGYGPQMTIDGDTLTVLIDEKGYDSSTGKGNNPFDLQQARGRWVQVTFNARIKDEYRSIDELKKLSAEVAGKNKSWEKDNTDKQAPDARDLTIVNGDKVLVKVLNDMIGPDEVIWAASGPSRLFARTESGDYYATPMGDKEGGSWTLLTEGSPEWQNAFNRYNGLPPYDTVLIDLDDDKLSELKKIPKIKGGEIEIAAEGPSRYFAKVIDGSGNVVYYQTEPKDDKSGTKWVVCSQSQIPNAISKIEGDADTIRFLDLVSDTFTLDGDSKNWPVISEDEHEGMANQGTFKVKFGNGAKGTYKTNTVTVNPESLDLTVNKKWVNAKATEIPSPEDFKSFLVLKSVKKDDGGEEKDITADHLDKLLVTKNDDGSYTAKWTGLPKLKSTEYSYEFDEKDMPGFTTEIDKETNTITNTKTREEKPEIEKYVNQAVHKDITLDEVFTYDIIAYITKDADSVTIMDTLNDVLTFKSKASEVEVVDLGENDNHLVTNNTSGKKVNDNASVAKEGTPIEAAKVTIDGQDLKVFITNTMKEITEAYDPVEITFVNPYEMGYYEKSETYEKTSDTALDSDKTYYIERGDDYLPVDAPSVDDIDSYYEKITKYVLTQDEEIVPDKTYYEKSGDTYAEVQIETVDPSDEGYYEKDGNGYKKSEDTSADPDKTYYVKVEITDGSRGYEYDGEDQPVTALRGHWVKVIFKARIKDGLKIKDVKKAFAEIKSDQVEDRAKENKGNAPVVSAENHTGIPNDARYTIGVASKEGIQEGVYADRSNTVTVKPKDTNGGDEDDDDEDKTKPEDKDKDKDKGKAKDTEKNSPKDKSTGTGDDANMLMWFILLIASGTAIGATALRLRRKTR